ncbi:hypothetical protein GCM10028864_60100 [Microlunatus parietis]
MPEIELSAGTLDYSDTGGTGPLPGPAARAPDRPERVAEGGRRTRARLPLPGAAAAARIDLTDVTVGGWCRAVTYCAAPGHAPRGTRVARVTPSSPFAPRAPRGTHPCTCSLRPPLDTTLLVIDDWAVRN